MNIEVQKDISLAKYSTWGIGRKAKYFIEIIDEKQLPELKAFLDKDDNKDLKVHVLGGGSNTLFSSNGFDGVVILVRLGFNEEEENDKKFTLHIVESKVELKSVPSGFPMGLLVGFCNKQGFSGFESAAGLPGTLGGAIRGNAGCFGWETKDNIESVRAWNIKTGEIKEFPNEECKFNYRESFFKYNPEWIILSATLKFTQSTPSEVRSKSTEIIMERAKRQPKKVKTCGSVFKNPKELLDGKPISAGFLIDSLGLKGTQVGGVKISEVHANFFENVDPEIATSDNVLDLIKICQEKVKAKYNIDLEPEVKVVGE